MCASIRGCRKSSHRTASRSSSRFRAAAATSTRSITRPVGCSSTADCSRPPPIPPTTASYPKRSAATATLSMRSSCWKTPSTQASGCRPARWVCCTCTTKPANATAGGRDPALLRGLQGAPAGQDVIHCRACRPRGCLGRDPPVAGELPTALRHSAELSRTTAGAWARLRRSAAPGWGPRTVAPTRGWCSRAHQR